MFSRQLTACILAILAGYGYVSGETCESLNSSPCFNGGVCSNTESGYECDCSAIDFTGDFCETAVDDCPSPDPCQNGGVCVDLSYDYACDCPSGYAGDTCQSEINECLASPCENGGTCVNTAGSYYCNCTDEYEGQDCDEPYENECDSDPCQHNGECTDAYNSYICDCVSDYVGDSCEIRPDNATHFTDTDSGCTCPDDPSLFDGCACCVIDGGFSACQCNSTIDATICVLCSDDQDRFDDWCRNPYYPSTGEDDKKKKDPSFLERYWLYLTIGGVAFVALVILIILIALAVRKQRQKNEEERRLKEAEEEEKRKNTEYTSHGAKKTGGNTWGAWDAEAFMQ